MKNVGFPLFSALTLLMVGALLTYEHTNCWNVDVANGKIFCAMYPFSNYGNGGYYKAPPLKVFSGDKFGLKEYDCHIVYGMTLYCSIMEEIR